MKTTLEFNDEELDLARMAFNGAEAHWALEAIDNQCRNWEKHGYKHVTKDKMLDIIREMTRLDLNN
jgi:hypothetical protein